MIGSQIAEFRIIEKLGEGGMGVVYKAMDVRLDRAVAIKMLSASLIDNPELVQRFQAEARAQANLNHTNLATLYAFLVDQGNAYMVMEFVEGENFDQIIRRGGPMSPQNAVPWFKQALLGIGAAHRMGIIHRDIKPSNLMLNRQGIVKVMDFGIAKAVGTRGMTRTGMHLGTLAYMSPEQIQNRTVDVRSDIYALGVTLYEMLSGHVPFESESDFQMMHDHVTSQPPLLSRYYPYAPREFEGVVARALAKNPDDRFQTVEAFGVALEHPENVAVSSAPLPFNQPAGVRSTVIDSGTGSQPWQSGGPGTPVSVATASSPGPVPWGTTAATPAPVAVVSGPPPSKKPSPSAGKIMVAAVVVVAAIIALAMVLRSGKTPASGPVAMQSGAGEAGPSIGPMSSRNNSSSKEIVVATGGPAIENTPPANAQPGNTSSRKDVSNQPPRQQPRSLPAQAQPAQTQPAPQVPPAYTPPQQPTARQATQSFVVKHRHVVRSGLLSQVYYCAGVLLVNSNGGLTYACAATNDPSKRCEQMVFPAGSIRQLTLRGGELHMGTTSMGNWDFYDYNVAGSIGNAYQAILPFVR